MAAARTLKALASRAAGPTDLPAMQEIRPALLTAAGLSDKAANHLEEDDKTKAIQEFIQDFLNPAGDKFVEELVYRFLLTRGDTLGGSMRNVGGFLAQKNMTRAILSALILADIPYWWLHATNNAWAAKSAGDADIELSLRGLSWRRNGQSRTLLYNLTVPLVGKNVDLCLFDLGHEHFANTTATKGIIQEPARYIAIGELKGGIDPAGADEHWKTARTALERIRQAFSSRGHHTPHTFFIGAAVEKSMAAEIWNDLETGVLENAANLTNDDQIASLTNWLCGL